VRRGIAAPAGRVIRPSLLTA